MVAFRVCVCVCEGEGEGEGEGVCVWVGGWVGGWVGDWALCCCAAVFFTWHAWMLLYDVCGMLRPVWDGVMM